MAKWSAAAVELQELDAAGQPIVFFKYDFKTNSLRPQHHKQSTPTSTSLVKKCMDPFLPAGYPSSVTPDYSPYQTYDSLQAFASTIAGLLASRAVFVGMGVGSEDASLVTTMLLYIAQETIGRVATILFAHQFSQRIEAEVKFYRFVADILNDIAFILDCLSPGLTTLGRVCTLCVSNACRAMCGVAGGSSKAILSAHFAKEDNIGELNAKDGSQETVVSLIGMWVGGLVVSRIHDTFETWCCLIPLLAMHLWANWKAVKSVRLTSLNAERADILFSALLKSHVKGLDEVGEEESILSMGKILPRRFNALQIGVSVADFVSHLPGEGSNDSQKYTNFVQLLQMFQDEDYVLWYDVETKYGSALLREKASAETQAKALCHLLRMSTQLRAFSQNSGGIEQRESEVKDQMLLEGFPEKVIKSTNTSSNTKANAPGRSVSASSARHRSFQLISETLEQNRQEWKRVADEAKGAGWDLSLTNLGGGRCNRIRISGTPFEDRKDK